MNYGKPEILSAGNALELVHHQGTDKRDDFTDHETDFNITCLPHEDEE